MPCQPPKFRPKGSAQPKAWAKPAGSKRAIVGRALQRARAALFDRQPLCEVCLKEGRTALATIRDHRIPLAWGGKDDVSNEQAICVPCHDEKSKGEAAAGRKRSA